MCKEEKKKERIDLLIPFSRKVSRRTSLTFKNVDLRIFIFLPVASLLITFVASSFYFKLFQPSRK